MLDLSSFSLRGFSSAFLILSACFFVAGCQTPAPGDDWNVPLTLKTFPPVYADRALEVADANKDGSVTLVEWTSAGGDKRSFLVADANRDGTVTRTELIRVGSNAKFFDFTRRYADFNKDNRMTPREFRSASGVRVLRFEF